MAQISKRLLLVFLMLIIAAFIFSPAQAQENNGQAVVRVVLFYSPTCPHCEEVIQNVLPPILAEYGDQLKIVAINVTLPDGQELYQSAVAKYAIPDERTGVPTMIIGDIVLVGGGEIPTQFPGIVVNALSEGGTQWPDIPGFSEVVAGVKFSSQPSGSIQQDDPSGNKPPMVAKFLLDPVANSIAVAVLLGMLASIIGAVISFTQPVPEKDFWPKWVIPLLSIAGMGVAFYLTYVETSGVEAICGPVGDCNTVQLSPYATLFGFLHVGLLGLIGYALILVVWAVYTFGPLSLRWASAIGLWGMAFFGVLFSIYLTFLEPFVIGATCMWCISSAIIMTIIFVAATGPAKRAWQEDDFEDEDDEEDESDIPDPEGDEHVAPRAALVEDSHFDPLPGEEETPDLEISDSQETGEVE